jgi:hypothetical protein
MRLSTTGLALALLIPGAAGAADLAPLLVAPAVKAPPQTKMAVLYALKLKLPEGRGLARLLLQAGVDQSDAAAAAKLAAGHLGDGSGGCDANVEISRDATAGGLRLERVELLTRAGRTIIERRQGELTVASQQGAGNNSRLV